MALERTNRVLQRFDKWLEGLVLVPIVDKLGKLSVLLAAVLYMVNYPGQRHEESLSKHRQAWMVINTASGKPGNGGRSLALQELNEDNITLAGIDLHDSNLYGAQLPGANLSHANLKGADLTGANLDDANLEGADLTNAILAGATIRKAVLKGANLQGANLRGAILDDSLLIEAKTAGVDLGEYQKLIPSTAGAAVTFQRASILRTIGLSNCDALAQTKDWEKALRDQTTQCGRPIPSERIYGYDIGSHN